jgi:hypothetical protein
MTARTPKILLGEGSSRRRARPSRRWGSPGIGSGWFPRAVVSAKLLRAPDAAARLAQTTIAVYSLSAAAIRRMHAWRASAAAP